MPDRERSALLEAARVPEQPWTQRLIRWLFRQRPLDISTPFASQAADARAFTPTEEGSASFGRWTLDDAGLPAYQYELRQEVDPRAAYVNTEKLDRRDHWHQVGNRRVTALASNDGVIQVYMADRGGVFLNRFEAFEAGYTRSALTVALFQLLQWLARLLSRRLLAGGRKHGLRTYTPQAAGDGIPPRGAVSPDLLAASAQGAAGNGSPTRRRDPAATRYAFGGGFGYVDDGTDVWATAHRFRPPGAASRRVFGMGYAEYETTHRDVRVTRRVVAPFGDDPLLVADVQLENLSAAPVALRYYEYWDINLQQLRVEWLRSGAFGPASDDTRRRLAEHFACGVAWDDDAGALRARLTLKQPAPSEALSLERISDVDWGPLDLFLADLQDEPDAFYTDKAAFFGAGGAVAPTAARERRPGEPNDPDGQHAPGTRCLALRRDLTLGPAEKARLRFAYGAVRPGDTATPSGEDEAALGFLARYRHGDPLRRTQDCWKEHLAYFSTGEDPVLQRETAWHAYNLLSATTWNSFHRLHVVPQGSAYLYLHGADGAPRDQALFSLALTYVAPELARELIVLLMQLQNAHTGRIPYAFTGHGFVDDALGLHAAPSDLDLFFMLAVTEYLAATGDNALLYEEIPFYPPDAAPREGGTTGLDHIRAAARNLFESVGAGRNGLIKVGSGDWSDGIVIETALADGIGPFGVTYQNSKRNGESVPNTQMALYVLPVLAALVEAHDGDLAAYLRAPLAGLREAAARQWNPAGWYNRAILRGADNREIVVSRFELEAQPWALISGLAGETGTQGALIARIDALVDGPSPIGAALRPGGPVWPAVSQLLTWAYARCGHPDLAWRALNRHTFAIHSHVYPDIWFGAWSGPDGINGLGAEQPGGTWSSIVTPMTDFPVMNANPDALALLALLRVCGVEPAPGGDGLLIHPRVPRERFTLDTRLLRLDVAPNDIGGEYRAFARGSRALYVYVPDDAFNVRITVGGEVIPNWRSGSYFMLPMSYEAGQVVAFAVRWEI